MARDIDRHGEFIVEPIRGGLDRSNGGEWVATPIPDAPGWYVACLLLRRGEGVTLAELRIIPNTGRYLPTKPYDWKPGEWIAAIAVEPRPAGEWSRRPSDLRDEQSGGITSRMLRKVPLAAIMDEALRRVNDYDRLPKSWDALASNAPHRPGRAGRDDRHYAIWAKRYVEADPRRRIRNLSERFGEPYGAITQWVFDAREKGFLTRTKQGRSGGVLTEKTLATLKEKKR